MWNIFGLHENVILALNSFNIFLKNSFIEFYLDEMRMFNLCIKKWIVYLWGGVEDEKLKLRGLKSQWHYRKYLFPKRAK